MHAFARRIRRLGGRLWLAAAVVVVAAGGTALIVGGFVVRASPAATNQAVTNAAATRQVARVVKGDVEQVFSYRYNSLQATRQAASRTLSGSAARQYGELFPQLKNAVSQKLSVVSKVTRVGVTSLTGGSAQLLVFMNQTATRGSASASPTPYHAQLAITAALRGGHWRITSIAAR